MMAEFLSGLALAALVMVLFATILVTSTQLFTAQVSALESSTQASQLQMLLQGDLFVRRRSPIYHTLHPSQKVHLLGFWEETADGEWKFVCYQLRTNDTGELLQFRRYVIDPENATVPGRKVQMELFIQNMQQGTYQNPSPFFTRNDYTPLAQAATFFHEEQLSVLAMAQVRFYFPGISE
ncbi:MAG TPA: hypothetical protein P5560_01370 [Thermotogota bacterium]|nr:hypothetical protein [Thermotogota bacterium]HRW91578.1 hypothetical protein [Thermotogota bacterium]